MPKIYRTMQGEQVDIEALFRKNELTVAVGNMQSNARGDELGPRGTIVKTREQKARDYYLRQKARKAAESAQADEAVADTTHEESVTATDEPLPEELVKEKVEKILDDPEGSEGL